MTTIGYIVGSTVSGGGNRWYVDAEAGNDANGGRSVASPRRTLASLDPVPGDTVYLRRGRRFHEELTGWPAGVLVRAYGAGERPIIDGRDVCDTWTVESPGVWRTDWAHGFGVDGGKSRHRVWEDGVMMARAESVAALVPGSFYAGAPTEGGPDTVYVCPSSGDIETHEYRLTRRRYCVQLYQEYHQANVVGLETIGNAYADGSIIVDGYVEDCVARDGRVHNVFVLGTAVNVQALGIEPGFCTMFISYYDGTGAFGGPATRDIVYRGCVADAQGYSSLCSAYYVHTNNDGRIFGTVQFEDCHAEDCRDGWAGNAAEVFLCKGCTYTNITFGFSFQPTEEVVLLGGAGELSAIVNGKLFTSQAPFRLTAHGLKCLAPGGGQGPILINHAGAEVSIDRCTVVAPNGGAVMYTRGDITLRRSIFTGNNLISAFLGGAGAQVDGYDADQCCYYADNVGNGAFGRAFGGTEYFLTLGSWQAYQAAQGFAGGRDANSLAVNANVNTTTWVVGNGAVPFGAVPNDAEDTDLQALWTQYRVEDP